MILNSNGIGEYLYQLEPDESGILHDTLCRHYGYSGRVLRRIRREGIIEANGKPARLKEKAEPGSIIHIKLPEEDIDTEPVEGPINVVYEDDEVLALNKGPDTVSHPTKRHQLDTLGNFAAWYLRKNDEHCKLRFVNRLDRDTSGLIIIAKNKFVHHYIQSRMPTDDVSKEYIAFVEGNFSEPEGTVNLPIGRPDPESIERTILPEGQPSVTHYRVLEQYKDAAKIACTLETGRTHQIRVHMKAAGHPIIGDPLYNPESVEKFGIARQALHAEKLRIPLPKKGIIRLTAPLPDDLIRLEKRLRGEN